MDDLLREYLKPSIHPHSELTHKNTLSTPLFPECSPRGETDTFTRSFANSHDRRQPSGTALVSQTKTRYVGSVVFLSSLFTSRIVMKPFHNSDYCLLTMQKGFFEINLLMVFNDKGLHLQVKSKCKCKIIVMTLFQQRDDFGHLPHHSPHHSVNSFTSSQLQLAQMREGNMIKFPNWDKLSVMLS